MTDHLKKEVLVKNLSEVLFLPDNDKFHKMPKSRCMTLDNVVNTYRNFFNETYLNINFNHSSPYIYQNQDTAFINKIFSSLRVLNEGKLNFSRELDTATKIKINNYDINYDISATYLLDIEKTEKLGGCQAGKEPSLFYSQTTIQILKNFKNESSESEVILDIISSADKHSIEVNNDEFIGSIYICKISKEETHYSGYIGKFDGIDYVSGSGIILSKLAIKSILKLKNQLDESVVEDVAIGKLLKLILKWVHR